MDDKIYPVPQFVGKTELHTKIRRIGVGTKIMVTVIDYSPLSVNVRTSDTRSARAAAEEARRHAAVSPDFTRLPTGETIDTVTDVRSGKRSKVRVRSACYVFSTAA